MIPAEFFIYAKARAEQIKQEQENQERLTARICVAIATFVPMRTKRGKRYEEKDFMPRKKQTQKEMLREIERLNYIFGGEVRRKRGG